MERGARPAHKDELNADLSNVMNQNDVAPKGARFSSLLDLPSTNQNAPLSTVNINGNSMASNTTPSTLPPRRKPRSNSTSHSLLTKFLMKLAGESLDTMPDVWMMTQRSKITFALQSRAMFWTSLLFIKLSFITFMWEFADQDWGEYDGVVLGAQTFFTAFFAAEVALRAWVSSFRVYLNNFWQVADMLIVLPAFACTSYCFGMYLASEWSTCQDFLCFVRHIIILRLITLSHNLAGNDLHVHVEHSTNDLEMSGLAINSSDIQLGRKLGSGAYGEVYLGLYRGTLVAVKSLFDTEKVTPQLFSRELSILTLLRHPNVVLFMGVVDESERFWFVTEYCANGSLADVLYSRKLFQRGIMTQRALELAIDICRGLAYLHGHNRKILHRDLKTANVLVSASMQAKVADFGESVIRPSVRKSARAVGTVQYSAPEVLRAEVYSMPADVFSLGIILWELAAMNVPHRGKSRPQIVYSVGFEKLRPNIEEVPLRYEAAEDNSTLSYHTAPYNNSVPAASDISDRMSTEFMSRYRYLVEWCWTEKPADRPTAQQALQELESILHSAGAMAHSIDHVSVMPLQKKAVRSNSPVSLESLSVSDLHSTPSSF